MPASTISIALCTYNGAAFLREQLQSIATQSRVPDELVVCDDQSSDDTVKILQEFSLLSQFPVHTFINEQRLGSTKNFEKAISLCHGDIIALADQDDVWLPEKLRKLEKAMTTSTNIGAVFSDGHIVDGNLHPVGLRLWQSAGFTANEQAMFESGCGISVLLKRNVVTGATLAFWSRLRNLLLPIPTEWIDETPPRWLHDSWIALLISCCADIAIIREPLILYRRHMHQQTWLHSRVETKSKKPIGKQLYAEFAAARQKPTFRLLEIAQKYQIVRDRLVSNNPDGYRIESLLKVEEAIRHLTLRTRLPASLLSRWIAVFKEALSGHYHLYSNGWKSLAKDLSLRPNSKKP